MEGPPVDRVKGETNVGIVAWIAGEGRVVSRADIAAAFPQVKATTLDSNLARMVKNGQLVRPVAGCYAIGEKR